MRFCHVQSNHLFTHVVDLIASHLQHECAAFATSCWTQAIPLEDVFAYPTDAEWFTVAILAIHELHAAISRREAGNQRQQ